MSRGKSGSISSRLNSTETSGMSRTSLQSVCRMPGSASPRRPISPGWTCRNVCLMWKICPASLPMRRAFCWRAETVFLWGMPRALSVSTLPCRAASLRPAWSALPIPSSATAKASADERGRMPGPCQGWANSWQARKKPVVFEDKSVYNIHLKSIWTNQQTKPEAG